MNRKRILIHASILFSITFLLSLAMAVSSEDIFSFEVFLKYFLQASSSILFFLLPPIYLNIYWLIPNFIEKKRYGSYVIITIMLIIGWGSVLGIGEPLIDQYWFDQPKEEPSVQTGILGMIFLIIITTLLHLTYRWFAQSSKIKQIENDQLHLELSSLKNQINPHFFFNTLNNLYALSLEKSDETPSVILKLSEMMRYTIYDCKESNVPISGEVTNLENFIALQKVRHHERGRITFKTDISDATIQVAPMILIVFLENAFKHGFDLMEKNAFIHLNLIQAKHTIHFYIENNFEDSENEYQTGIGLKNVKRRLSLIYPNTHKLKIIKSKGVFSVDLKLYLK